MKTLLAFLTLAVALAHGHHYEIDRTQDLKRGFDIPDDIPDVFGRVHDLPEYLISNGYEAAEGAVPYVVSILLTNGLRYSVCAGSIIGDNWILTSAHCLATNVFGKVIYGSNNYRNQKKLHKVRKNNFIIHEQFDHSKYTCNIGLIRTPSRIEFSTKISKIALPKFSDQADSMVGWNTKSCGWNTNFFADSELLECGDVNIISNEECAKKYVVSADMVCTRVINYNGSCDSDSGGPLVTRSNPPTLVGVVSFGLRHCQSMPSSINARVSYFLKWIHEKTGISILS